MSKAQRPPERWMQTWSFGGKFWVWENQCDDFIAFTSEWFEIHKSVHLFQVVAPAKV